jgi:hypothetical protein
MGNTLFKNTQGYGYKYTDISEIHRWLEENGIEYYQYIEPIDGNDYIFTVPIIKGEEKSPRRGCRVITASLSGKTNPAQEQGSGLTYARRYSLLMAFGLATTDDDAACMTEPKIEKVKGEVVKPSKKTIPGYPSKDIMLDIVAKHYPEGHPDREKVCSMYKVSDISELSMEVICKIYDKFGGR